MVRRTILIPPLLLLSDYAVRKLPGPAGHLICSPDHLLFSRWRLAAAILSGSACLGGREQGCREDAEACKSPKTPICSPRLLGWRGHGCTHAALRRRRVVCGWIEHGFRAEVAATEGPFDRRRRSGGSSAARPGWQRCPPAARRPLVPGRCRRSHVRGGRREGFRRDISGLFQKCSCQNRHCWSSEFDRRGLAAGGRRVSVFTGCVRVCARLCAMVSTWRI